MLLSHRPRRGSSPRLRGFASKWTEAGTFVRRRDGTILDQLAFSVDLKALWKCVRPVISRVFARSPFGEWSTHQNPGMAPAMAQAFFGVESMDPALT